MLIKPIYELLPSAYLALGSGSVVWSDSGLGLFGGVLLFILGALVWVMRSNYRRQDEAIVPTKPITIPESIYEFMPFVLLAMAVGLVANIPHPLAYLVAIICSYRGLQLLYLRHRYRQFAWDLSSK